MPHSVVFTSLTNRAALFSQFGRPSRTAGFRLTGYSVDAILAHRQRKFSISIRSFTSWSMRAVSSLRPSGESATSG